MEKRYCVLCGELIEGVGYTDRQGQHYCNDCGYENLEYGHDNLRYCPHCGRLLPEDTSFCEVYTGSEVEYWCLECSRHCTWDCDECGMDCSDTVKEYVTYDGRHICDDCFLDYFTICDGCGKAVDYDVLIDDCYCPNCHAEMQKQEEQS